MEGPNLPRSDSGVPRHAAVTAARRHVNVKALGLSDLPEQSEKEARRVAFLIGDLSYLDETQNAWVWAVNTLIHKDDNLFMVHCKPAEVPGSGALAPMASRSPSAGQGGARAAAPSGNSPSSWLPRFIRADLAGHFLAHRTVLIRAPAGQSAGEVVAEWCRRERIALVIMGCRDMSPTAQLFLGSTSKYLVANCACPCVVTRRPIDGKQIFHTRPRHVVIALNNNVDLSLAVVRWSLSNCLMMDDLITVASCVENPHEKPGRRLLLQRAAADIKKFKDEHRQQNPHDMPDVQIQVLEGKTGPVLTQAILNAKPKVDLLLVGSRGHTGIKKAVMGSVSSYFLDHVPCPVAVVRRGSAG